MRDDDDIGGGASFSLEIEKALNECDAVLVLWSADSVQSSWVRDEAGFGRDAGKLIPFSLDGAGPPLGFRQIQVLDLSKWRGRTQGPDADRIRSAIARVAHLSAAVTPTAPSGRDHPRSVRRPKRPVLAAGLFVLVAAAFGSIFLWRSLAGEQAMVILVSASPTSPDRTTAADYANVTAADMAAFLPMRFDEVKVIAPAFADGARSAYRVQIAADHHGQAADASVTLSDRDGQSILWSKSWNIPDSSRVDLGQEVSRFSSQAAACLVEATTTGKSLTQPALGEFVSGCVGITDPDWSEPKVLATFERIVKLNPEFARGWSYLSVGRALFAEAQESGPTPAYVAAAKSARQAIALARNLDPHSGLPYLAQWHLDRKDPLGGLQLLDKAVEIDPDEPVLHARRSDALQAVGRMSDAVAAAHRATELNPLWSFAREKYIDALTYAGQFSRAKDDIADAHRKWPINSEIDSAQFDFEYRYGDPRIAEELLPRVLNYSDVELLPYRKIIAARLEQTPTKVEEAIDEFREADRRDPQSRNREFLALGLFGRVDEAYQLLSDPGFLRQLDTSILFRPEFARVRADRRFMRVAAQLGLMRYWTQSGNWPDFCREKLAYDCRSEAAKYPHGA